jgi:hypothetical protein
MFARKISSLFASGLMAAFAVALVGCGGDSSLGPGGNTTSQVRVLDAMASPGVAAVDIAQRTNNVYLVQNVPYGQATAYKAVASANGVNHFIYQTGTTTEVAPQHQFDLSPNAVYTLAVIGDTSQAAGSTYAPQLIRIIDNRPAPSTLTNNKIAIRVINLAPSNDASLSGISLYNAGQPITGLTGVTYGNATNYVTLPISGAFSFSVNNSTSNNPIALPAATVSGLAAATLTPGKSYSLVVLGIPGAANPGNALNAVLLTDS